MINTASKANIGFRWLGVSLVTLLVACSGSDSDNDTNTDDASNTLTGSVFASAVNGASCEITDSIGDIVAGPFTTSEEGAYSITLPDDRLAEDLVIACSGGTFTDEATGLTNRSAGTMATYIAGGALSTGSAIHVTPSSTVIHNLITDHGKTPAEAATIFEAAFGFVPDPTTTPTDATAPAQGAEEASLLSGLRAAAFSQLASDLGLLSTDQFALFTALAIDLADGLLDGKHGADTIIIDGTSIELPADIQNRFGRALVNFRAGGRDASGLANNAFGILPFAKTAMTHHYKIEYLPGMHGAINGKTEFTLKVGDHSGVAQTGLDVSIKSKMNMDGMVHGTPFEGMCHEGATSGEYGCTVYYLMPSVMMNGMSMGFWELKVMIGGHEGEHTFFHPTVKMAMGDTAQVRLKGLADKISSSMDMNHDDDGSDDNGGSHAHATGTRIGINADDMMAETEARTYYLFKKALTGVSGNHSFELFIAAKENMMDYPAVSIGTTLNSGDMHHELSIATMSVEVSTDGINWVVATDHGEHGHTGHWLASGISGLTDGTEAKLFVKLVVGGEKKTTDGDVPNALPVTDDANNNYARFTVTPGSSSMQM